MEAAPGVYSLSQRQGGNVHAFVIDDGNDLTVVDTLFDGDGKRILAQLQAIGKTPQDVKRILVTHAHRSHLGGLARLKAVTEAPIYAHEWEADIISGDRKAQPVSVVPSPPYRTYPLQIGLNLDIARHAPVAVDYFVHEGDQIGPLRVLFAPGHSPGHLAFYWPERRVLIAGDAICTWPTFMLGWKGFLLNPKQHQASLRRLAELDADVLCVGHGDPLLSRAAAQIRAALSH